MISDWANGFIFGMLIGEILMLLVNIIKDSRRER